MSESIKIFAPATVANVSCGFDIFGLAVDNPGDEVILTKRNDNKIVIKEITGDEGKLTYDPEKNTVSVPILRYLDKIQNKTGFDIILNKKMPLGSGLGSSSASSVAGVFAANELLNNPLEISDLLPFSMEGERIACGAAHADNVAPALLGGFVIIRSYEPLDFIKINTPDELYVSIVHPDLEVNTKDARIILRQEAILKKIIAQTGNVAGMVAGLMSSNYGLIGRSMTDYLVEPNRAILIPYFNEVKQAALETGALGASISGAGPSIFAFSQGKEMADKVGQAMKAVFTAANINTNLFVSGVNQNGPRILD
ncbi:homoserine kinase [Arcticibacterium luteifluviistationis]|uniref:Homoserine kinase n=1 Tax=Arcticibacterium luteifluviistationis TaxID=1784714 RepID=A0A2Z4GAD2_9BACT|nr:homoserine kinase [Arcticibacterium luteifluviistationis]AWV98219.1 homoserine kinase [Arcticibacterium luteifluviistationis]